VNAQHSLPFFRVFLYPYRIRLPQEVACAAKTSHPRAVKVNWHGADALTMVYRDNNKSRLVADLPQLAEEMP
jgi:hypothetical protein